MPHKCKKETPLTPSSVLGSVALALFARIWYIISLTIDHADDEGDDDVFVYMGGLIPEHLKETITHVRIHKSVKIIRSNAFQDCVHLVSIEMHDGVEITKNYAFSGCISLREIKLPGVRVIEEWAFSYCEVLTEVEFGDKLDIIQGFAFAGTDLRIVKILKVRVIGSYAFAGCEQLMEVELSEDLETIGDNAFYDCSFRRIALPLKDNLLHVDAFYECDDLSQVALIGGIHKTISSLLLDSWINEMKDEIDSINQVLPNTDTNDKTWAIDDGWKESYTELNITNRNTTHY